MSPKNAKKAKLDSAHSFMFQFCFQAVCFDSLLSLIRFITKSFFNYLNAYSISGDHGMNIGLVTCPQTIPLNW